MSRIYFHSPSETTEVFGRERHLMGEYASDLSWVVLEHYAGYYRDKPIILKIIPPNSYVHKEPHTDVIRTWFNLGNPCGDGYFLVDKKRVDIFDIQLNTLFRMGNDSLKLAARIQGQCETHAFVEGVNRAWVAKIIKQGLATGIYRENMGWEKTIEMLCSRADEPVVMSYSVCDGFPPYDPESDTMMSWTDAMTQLRDNPFLEIKPEGWEDYYFGEGVDAFDIAKHLDSLSEHT